MDAQTLPNKKFFNPIVWIAGMPLIKRNIVINRTNSIVSSPHTKNNRFIDRSNLLRRFLRTCAPDGIEGYLKGVSSHFAALFIFSITLDNRKLILASDYILPPTVLPALPLLL